MSAKFVKYNGGTQFLYPCTEPKDLVVGQIYELTCSHVYDWHTEYSLKGVKGKFNSVWFDEVQMYKAVAPAQPIVGYPLDCIKVVPKDGRIELHQWRTTKVVRIDNIESGIFRVITHNSIYDIMVP